MKFRADIQGLRAFAVIIVLFFHLGLLKNGYLGVDIFFVISGFLITGIVYKDFLENNYSIKEFYIRRIRRILPLVLIVEVFALILGYFFMLPDDLENLGQSVVATNFFANNVLQFITTGNYWDVVNDYKPMLHTWSLGIEEQYYLLFPLIFLFISKKKNLLSYILVVLTILSVLYYIFEGNQAFKFYMLPTRFFQISIGGLSALFIQKFKKNAVIADVSFVLVLILVFVNLNVKDEFLAIFSVLLTCSFIIFNTTGSVINKILTIKPIVFLGTISFSIYMWHQVIISFYRYIFSYLISPSAIVFLLLIIFILSVLSYYFIEEFFRRSKNISFKKVFSLVIFLFLITTGFSLFIYKQGGVVKDFKELSLTTDNAKRGVNSQYNDSVFRYDKAFGNDSKKKVLVIGDSYGRDWINLLLQSKYKDELNFSYIDKQDRVEDIKSRGLQADVIFISYMTGITSTDFNKIISKNKLDSKVFIVGTKNFGTNNGVYYNKKRDENYCKQRAKVEDLFLKINDEQRQMWGNKYINVLSFLIDKNNTVSVFTGSCTFISQDCRHLTKDGAIYLSDKIDLTKYLNITEQ
ncbi:acyltransferase [Empedobacter sp.]|uniref:acyltransferase family protein n=1 Tax=Empedobacter sp. TaxID=1927715 RepID=UPI0028AD956F|nr:acyltransferase [Empedobacter sp.]